MATLSSIPFCTGPSLDLGTRFAQGFMGASIGLAIMEVAREQGADSVLANEYLGAVGGLGGAKYVLRTAQKAVRDVKLQLGTPIRYARARRATQLGLGGMDFGTDLGRLNCPDCPPGPDCPPIRSEFKSYVDWALRYGKGQNTSAGAACYWKYNPSNDSTKCPWDHGDPSIVGYWQCMAGNVETGVFTIPGEGDDIIRATLRFIAESFSKYNPLLHPGEWYEHFKAYLRKWDITSSEGQEAMGAFLDLMPFFWPLGTLVKNLGRLVQCLKATGCDDKRDRNCRSRPGFFGCVADLLVNSIKDIITSPYFLLVVGVLTGNAVQTAQAGLRVVGTSVAQAMSVNSQYARYGGYVRMGFEVAADSTDILRVCQSQGLGVARNPAIYVMVGEMLVQRAGSTLPEVSVGGAFIRDHASILAKLASGDVTGAFTELKAKYIDSHIATVQDGIARIQNLTTISAWKSISSGMNSLSAFFSKISSESSAGDNFIQRAGAWITTPVAALAKTFREASASVATIALTMERGMAVVQNYTWAQVVLEAKQLVERTGAELLADANASVATQQAQQTTAAARQEQQQAQQDSAQSANAAYVSAQVQAAMANAAAAAAAATTKPPLDLGAAALLGGGALVGGMVIAKLARKRKSR